MGCSLNRGTRSRLRALYKSGELHRIPVRGDGACFYRALSYSMFGDESNWRWVKEHTLRYMACGPERDEFLEWYAVLRLMDDEESPHDPPVAYYSPDSVFADDLIARAASAAFSIRIWVMIPSDDRHSPTFLKITPPTRRKRRPFDVLLYLSREHYEPCGISPSHREEFSHYSNIKEWVAPSVMPDGRWRHGFASRESAENHHSTRFRRGHPGTAGEKLRQAG